MNLSCAAEWNHHFLSLFSVQGSLNRWLKRLWWNFKVICLLRTWVFGTGSTAIKLVNFFLNLTLVIYKIKFRCTIQEICIRAGWLGPQESLYQSRLKLSSFFLSLFLSLSLNIISLWNYILVSDHNQASQIDHRHLQD